MDTSSSSEWMDRLRVLEDEVARLRSQLGGGQVDATRIALRGADGNVLWQITAQQGEGAGSTELLFHDQDGKTVATLRREDFGFGKYYPTFELASNEAKASLRVATAGRGTEIPVLVLTKPSSDDREDTISLALDLHGPRLDMNGSDGALSVGVQDGVVMTDSQGEELFRQPPSQ